MAKARGLPEGFALSVPSDAGQSSAPVHIPSYLDRHLATTSEREGEESASVTKDVMPRQEPTPPPPTRRKEIAPVRVSDGAAVAPRRIHPKLARRAPRKEVSIDADSLRKAEEVVNDIRDQGPQPDASTSELVRALLQLAHEVRHKADYMHLNRRGQFGSATARAFVADIKDAFLRAIGQLYVDRYPNEAKDILIEPP